MINWKIFKKKHEYITYLGSLIFIIKCKKCNYVFEILSKINYDKNNNLECSVCKNEIKNRRLG